MCKEKNFLQNFFDLNGKEFLESILSSDSSTETKENKFLLFVVNPYYNFNNKVLKHIDDQDLINLETLNILNKLLKNNYQLNDFYTISDKIIDAIK